MNRISKILSFAALLMVWTAGNSAIPSGYYDGLEGLSGVSLKKAVKSAARSHTAISYNAGTWGVFIDSDTRMVDGRRCWWDMYSDNNVPAPNSSSHDGMNIEHGVPNSWWGKTQNDAYKDLFHLNPSDKDANSRKSNYPLGEIASQTWSNGVTFIGKPTASTGGDASYVFEPADEYKGDFARAYFYMFTIYDDIQWTSSWNWMYNTSSDLLLKPWAYEMLLRWAQQDPVSQKEIERNEAIYNHQKNRNPFIDYPELAEHIWGSKKNTPFHLDGSVTPDPDPDPTPDPTPKPDPNPVTSGYWYAVTSSSDLNENDHYVVVSTETQVVMSRSTGSSGQVAYIHPCSKSPTFDKTVSPARISSIPDDAAIITLTKSGSSWIMAVSDKNGKSVGSLSSAETKKVTVSSTGTPASISPSSSSTNITFGSIKGNLQYNNNDNGKRFTTYTSSLEPIMLYRLQADHENAGVGTGLDVNADEVIFGIYDINGRKVAAQSVSDLENGLYIVISNFGTKKVYKGL